MKKLVVLALACVALASCRLDVEPYGKGTQMPDASKAARDSVRLAMVVKGDTAGMGGLEQYYKQRGRELDLLPFYVVLADKYGNADARAKIVDVCSRLSAKYPKLDVLRAKYANVKPLPQKDDEAAENKDVKDEK